MFKLLVFFLAFLLSTSVAAQTTFPQTYYISTASARARSCERTDCTIVTRLTQGTAITVTDIVEGTPISGNRLWLEIEYDGRSVYVHSSLATRTPPAATPAGTSQQSRQSRANDSQLMSTPVPALPRFSCNCSKTCEQMASCEEAYYQLNQCGCGRRDHDSDGVPCESICTGG